MTCKPHRFDHFARKIAASMIEAIRVTLSVFDLPDKDRWTPGALFERLRSAEALARDMLREIAEKIFVYPPEVRERRETARRENSPQAEEKGYWFRLGVKAASGGQACASPSRLREGDRGGGHGVDMRSVDSAGRDDALTPNPFVGQSHAIASPPKPAAGRGEREAEAQSLLTRRIAALEDVIAQPGKHAARMARALYRAEYADGDRLIARSENELLLDHCNHMADNPAYAASEAGRLMHRMLGIGGSVGAAQKFVWDSS